jgi:hypothetical protein
MIITRKKIKNLNKKISNNILNKNFVTFIDEFTKYKLKDYINNDKNYKKAQLIS